MRLVLLGFWPNHWPPDSSCCKPLRWLRHSCTQVVLRSTVCRVRMRLPRHRQLPASLMRFVGRHPPPHLRMPATGWLASGQVAVPKYVLGLREDELQCLPSASAVLRLPLRARPVELMPRRLHQCRPDERPGPNTRRSVRSLRRWIVFEWLDFGSGVPLWRMPRRTQPALLHAHVQDVCMPVPKLGPMQHRLLRCQRLH